VNHHLQTALAQARVADLHQAAAAARLDSARRRHDPGGRQPAGVKVVARLARTTAANSGSIAAHRYALPIVREIAPIAASPARNVAPLDAQRRGAPAANTPNSTRSDP
jgi:hypothetical protein